MALIPGFFQSLCSVYEVLPHGSQNKFIIVDHPVSIDIHSFFKVGFENFGVWVLLLVLTKCLQHLLSRNSALVLNVQLLEDGAEFGAHF